jgi:hypothetical protein
MSKASQILSPEEIRHVNAETKAAVQRAREVLARLREENERLGPTPEQLQKMYDSALPSTREWIDRAVKIGRAKLTRIVSGNESKAPARPRKLRSMV